MTEAYDLVAIGAGPAGESVAELAAFCVSKASRFTLLVSKQSRFAFSVNEPSSIWLYQYKRNAAR